MSSQWLLKLFGEPVYILLSAVTVYCSNVGIRPTDLLTKQLQFRRLELVFFVQPCSARKQMLIVRDSSTGLNDKILSFEMILNVTGQRERLVSKL